VNAKPAPEGLLAWTHVIYALHAATVLIGATSGAFIATVFVFSVPSVIAVILSYVKRGDSRGTFLESHFRWLIRTFWFAVLWCAIGGVLALTIVGIPLAWVLFAVTGIWLAYRVIRGWLALNGGKAIAVAA
jgi:uncharacterized membrane protein